MAQQQVWTILKILDWTKNYLSGKGVHNSRLESEWLLCSVTGLDRVGLYLNFDKPLSDPELADFRAMVTRRAKREPLQHILGNQEFFGLDFEVSSNVLVPRYDTEVLITLALSLAPMAHSVLDIGTGSGCIAISLATRLPSATITATDISQAALTIANRNAVKHSVIVEMLLGSLLDPVESRSFDLIVSNPPYIPTAYISELEPEVREYDPLGALDGGLDGLDMYRKLIPLALSHLNTAGWLILEVGSGQSKDVIQICTETCGYELPITALDSGGIERVVAAQRKD